MNRSHRLLHLPALLALVAALALGSAPARVALAAGITVNTTADELNTDGDCSLREAVRSVSMNIAVDACPQWQETITLPAGTYTLSIPGSNEDAAATGDLDLRDRIFIIGAGAATTIIDGGQLDRVFDARGLSSVEISGVTIRNGRSDQGSPGGGLRNEGSVYLRDSIVSGNLATGRFNPATGDGAGGTGGGIANVGVSAFMSLERTTVTANHAHPVENSSGPGGYAGGIANDRGALFLTDSTVSNNIAHSPPDDGAGKAGGIGTNWRLMLTRSTVSGNQTEDDDDRINLGEAGGLHNNGGHVTLNDSVFTNNRASNGGGIVNQSGFTELIRSRVSQNSTSGLVNLAGANVTLTDSTVNNNVADVEIGRFSLWEGVGGGIRNSGTLTLAGTTVRDNQASFGGGVASSGTLRTTGSTISGNQALYCARCLEDEDNSGDPGGHGGGLYSTGSTAITDTTVLSNTAAVHGGGISARGGSLSLRGSTIAANRARLNVGNGGGIESQVPLTIASSTIRDNSADDGGGVWQNAYTFGAVLTLSITDSTISGNQATGSPPYSGGGGVSIFSVGDSRITNTTISGNSTGGTGGGVRASIEGGGNVYLRNVTVANNNGGGGLYHDGNIDRTPDLSTVWLANTIVSGNLYSSGQPSDCVGLFTSQGYNLIGDPTFCQMPLITGDQQRVDARLGPLASNGGPTATHTLLPGSPAIDAGNPAVPGSSTTACPATDQRGTARPQGFADTARCDIGALERVGGSNLLANGSFEADSNSDGTPDGWSYSSRTSRSSAVVRTGSHALRHQATDNSSYNVFSDSVGVTAGQLYTFGAYVNIPTTSDTFSLELQVRWRDAANNILTTVPVKTYSAATGGWNLANVALLAPPNAATATVRMVVTSLNATLYVDDVSLQPTANRLGNSGFELDGNSDNTPDGWSANARVSRSNALVRSGTYAQRHQATDNASYTIFSDSFPGVVAGRPYSFNAYVNIPATSDTFSLEFQVRWRDAAGNVVSTVPVTTFNAATSGWTAATASLVAPPNADQASVRIAVTSLNATIYVDDVTLGP